MIFEPITEESLGLALEIVNSNPVYNTYENGHPSRILVEISGDFLDPATESYLIKLDNLPLGIIDFLPHHHKDQCPWIGLLMIHGDYHSLGYGKKVYASFEEELKRRNFQKVRLGVLQENVTAKKFWESVEFKSYGFKQWENKVVECFEKNLI